LAAVTGQDGRVTNLSGGPFTVVVYGGHGFFGRLVVEDLLANTDARIVIAGRRARQSPISTRDRFASSDLNDAASVRAVLVGASVLVNCAGPYQSQPLILIHEAIAAGVHYMDLAEDREFVCAAHECDEAARRAGVAVMSGLSVVPGLTALLVQMLRDRFDRVISIRTFVAPGTRGSRGPATVRSLLGGAGRPLRVLRESREHNARGWSEPEWIEFPPPVGWRLQYLAIETAGLDAPSRDFEAQRVEFKAGSEFPWLNRSLAVVARLRALTGFPPLARLADAMRIFLKLLGRFGTDAGGVLVEIAGTKKSEMLTEQVALIAENHGERIPSLPAAIAVAALLRGELTARGAVPLSTWISRARLFEEFRRRGLIWWLKPGGDFNWRALNNEADFQT
jgi:hypothetical protein